MGAFLRSLYKTLIFRIFWLAYPISLYFLYDNEQMISFYLTLVITFLSIIYFISYCIITVKNAKEEAVSGIAYNIKQYLYCLIGYLAQVNIIFMQTYEIIDGELIINYTLSVLKILMIIETLKRIYFYVVGIFLLFNLECHERGDRSLYVMSFEIVYFYLWENFYWNICSSGYQLPFYYFFIGIFFCLVHGVLALMSYFLAVKIIFGVLNLGYILGQIYTIYWRHREQY